MALEAWSREGRRAVACYDELGTYLMLYDADQCWASWGIVWRSDGVLLWDCVTHRDIDEFPSIASALAAIGPGADIELENVIPFADRRAARQVGL